MKILLGLSPALMLTNCNCNCNLLFKGLENYLINRCWQHSYYEHQNPNSHIFPLVLLAPGEGAASAGWQGKSLWWHTWHRDHCSALVSWLTDNLSCWNLLRTGMGTYLMNCHVSTQYTTTTFTTQTQIIPRYLIAFVWGLYLLAVPRLDLSFPNIGCILMGGCCAWCAWQAPLSNLRHIMPDDWYCLKHQTTYQRLLSFIQTGCSCSLWCGGYRFYLLFFIIHQCLHHKMSNHTA